MPEDVLAGFAAVGVGCFPLSSTWRRVWLSSCPLKDKRKESLVPLLGLRLAEPLKLRAALGLPGAQSMVGRSWEDSA